MSYKFQCTDYQGNILTLEFRAEAMSDVIIHLKDFLAGVGFSQDTIKDYFND